MPRASPIIAAKGRLSTNFAIRVSIGAKEAAVSARLPSPETGLGAHLRRLGGAKGRALTSRWRRAATTCWESTPECPSPASAAKVAPFGVAGSVADECRHSAGTSSLGPPRTRPEA
jgi:hypothetical protein